MDFMMETLQQDFKTGKVDEGKFTRQNYRPYFECSSLRDEELKKRVNIDSSTTSKFFSVKQQALQLFKIEEDENKKLDIKFAQTNVLYDCNFIKSDNFAVDKPTALLCIKDNTELLEYTLNNLSKYEVDRHCNILVIDDRPSAENKGIYDITKSKGYSYLSVKYGVDFNFSMLNNLGAAVCDALGNLEIVLWNSDLWAHDTETFPEILKLHRENNADISGAKLIYPDFDWTENKAESTAIEAYYAEGQAYKGMVQHGGVLFSVDNIAGSLTYRPTHDMRFAPPDNPIVNCDKGLLAVTGAFQVIKLPWFKKQGGFNPSLPRAFQDIDLCLKSERVFYFGKDRFFYHNESVSLITNKESEQHQLDVAFESGVLYSKIWNWKHFVQNCYNRYAIGKKIAHAADGMQGASRK